MKSLEDVQEVFDELSVKKSSICDSNQKVMSFKDSFNNGENIQLTQFKASELRQQREMPKSNQKTQSREGTATRLENPNVHHDFLVTGFTKASACVNAFE